jgi:hypothetical protein
MRGSWCLYSRISNASRVPIRSLAPDATPAHKRSLRIPGNGKLYLQLLKIKLHRLAEPLSQLCSQIIWQGMSRSRQVACGLIGAEEFDNPTGLACR